ncbi:phosphatase PAP2 family protein [Bogoriella caseilytica]|uniref:PAP2 superfamily protein n=1 Tax=Bogoriella caseilytica TaxID=56055 RepID=A0A3N2BD85_9MICO|nr:phosphatase PAP2 family protein [Bogoriella caseilytica]ROR73217.1 PAP2 superfamily protein [Bogoriella caseilytica]
MVYHPRDGARRVVAAAFALLCAGAVALVWWFFVTTPTGQRIDQLALEGSALGQSTLYGRAHQLLGIVSEAFLVVVVAVAGLFAALRRQWVHVVAIALVVGGANITTQVLKEYVFSRPDLGVTWSMANSLPSGHTTAAVSALAAGLLAVAPRWRWLVAGTGAIYAAATGVATMVVSWHRPGDVVAAVLVVGAWLLCALALLRREDVATNGGRMPSWARGADVATRALLGLTMAVAALVSFLALLTTRGAIGAEPPERFDLPVAYIGAIAAIIAITCLTTLLALVLSAPRSDPRRAGATR